MSQFELSLKPEMQFIDHKIIDSQPTFTHSIVLCQTLSGLEDKQIAGKHGIVSNVAQWSRIKSGQHFFPQDKLLMFMELCGNQAPLQWISRRSGYNLVEMESETERKLRIEREARERVEHENSMLKKLLMGRAE